MWKTQSVFERNIGRNWRGKKKKLSVTLKARAHPTPVTRRGRTANVSMDYVYGVRARLSSTIYKDVSDFLGEYFLCCTRNTMHVFYRQET